MCERSIVFLILKKKQREETNTAVPVPGHSASVMPSGIMMTKVPPAPATTVMTVVVTRQLEGKCLMTDDVNRAYKQKGS